MIQKPNIHLSMLRKWKEKDKTNQKKQQQQTNKPLIHARPINLFL